MTEGREPDDGLREKVDELEEKVFGERVDQTRDEERDDASVFEQDVDAETDERERGSGAEPA